MAISTWVGGALSAIDILCTGAGIAVDVHTNFQGESLTATQKTIRIGTDILCIGAQGARLAFQIADPASPRTNVLTVGIGEGANLIRQISRLACQPTISGEQGMDELAQLISSVARVVAALFENFPLAGPYTPLIIGVATAIQLASLAFIQRKLLLSVGQRSWSVMVNIVGSDEAPPSPVSIRLHVDADGVLALGEKYTAWMREVHNARGVDDFMVIPQLFQNDEQLIQRRCPITGKPIRFPVAATGQDGKSVKYEREAVAQLLQQNPPQVPPQWPEDLPLTLASLSNDEEGQKAIDARLSSLLEGVRAERIEPDQSMIALARNLFEGQTDVAVSDRILTNPKLAGLIAELSVYTLSHVFSGSLVAQKARMIDIITNRVWLPGHPSSNLEGGARAVLGSSDKEDLIALKVFAKNHPHLRMYFSVDFEFYDIEPNQPILALARPLIEDQTDVAISNRILNNPKLAGLISEISVYTLSHVFSKSSVAQTAKVIDIITNRVWLPGKYSSNLEGGARAILGSFDKDDIFALRVIAKNCHPLRVYLSVDFESCDIETPLKNALSDDIHIVKVEPDQQIVSLARQLSLAEDQTDVAICNRILSNPRLAGLVDTASVCTSIHVFSGSSSPQDARVIDISMRQVWQTDKHPPDFDGAARAILGSSDEADFFALRSLAKNHCLLRICFSSDLRACDVGAVSRAKRNR